MSRQGLALLLLLVLIAITEAQLEERGSVRPKGWSYISNIIPEEFDQVSTTLLLHSTRHKTGGSSLMRTTDSPGVESTATSGQ